MSTRLILLVLVAAGLAIGVGVKFSAPPNVSAEVDEDQLFAGKSGVPFDVVAQTQKALADRPLPGSEPPVPPEFILDVSVDPTGKKNRLYIDVTEVHGYYVETFRFGLYYKLTPDMSYEESPLTVDHFVDTFVPANDTLRVCMDFVPAELNRAEGVMGTDENWGAVVLFHGRAREKNPEPLPLLANAFDCD